MSGPLPSTAEERRIATPTELTNKQIAERLFLSHRTLGAHPCRICRRLGIGSCAAHCATPSRPGPGERLAPRRAGRSRGLRAASPVGRCA
ncbi:LuxR C-terminal-related transcriptional regulator [Streptomyces sp. NPDC005301]|uniref:LuxR C-terminal-related transcriptional regulator n=1 Tax=Streptomyces sp. NPDC005301 TaxID=3156874 RepID=UPI0033BCB9A3